LIDFDKLNPANATENVKLAFDVALEKFKIPQLLEVADVAGQAKPDEKSITTYVSLLFKEFASGVQKKKAATTISKAVNIAQRHQDLAAEYERSASGLLEWMTQQADRFQTLSQPRRILDIKDALANHLEYKKNEKPPREAEYVAVEGCAGRWVASCKNNNRDIPVLDPPVEKLHEVKARLDAYETEFELRLRENLESFQKTEIFLTMVVKELEKVESWAKDKESSPLFEEGLLATTTTDAEEKLESIGFIQEIELPRYKQLLATVIEHAEGLSAGHSDTKSTLERVEAMKSFVATVESRFEDTKTRLEQALQAQLEVDTVVKDCKLLMRNLKYVIEEMDEEIEAATNLNDVSKTGIIAAKEQFEKHVVPKVQEAVVSENEKLIEKKEILAQAGRASDVVLIEKCNVRVQKLLDSLEQKRGYFENEMNNVEKRDEICKQFAELSARIKERCARSTQSINTVEGSLGDQFTSMVKLRQKLFRSNTGIVIEEPVEEETASEETGEEAENGEAKESTKVSEEILEPLTEDMEQLEKISEQLEQLRVYTNPFTTDTIHGLRAQFQSLENAVRDKVKSLEKEVALSKLGNLTPQQLKEIREVFDHFDLDNDGVLARDEFIMACKGLGLSLSEDDCHDYFDKIDEDDNDEISFDEFSGFCAEQLQSGSTKEDVLLAFDVLTAEDLTVEKIEEQFDSVVVEFTKKNLDKLLKDDGVTLDCGKFTTLVFSL
jgi:Ca2+-binding EF-hand superfamily protein